MHGNLASTNPGDEIYDETYDLQTTTAAVLRVITGDTKT